MQEDEHSTPRGGEIKHLEVKLGHAPTFEEIRKKQPSYTVSMIREVIKYRQTCEPPVSLDAPTGEDGESFMEFVVLDPSVDIEVHADRSETQSRVSDALSQLNDSERRIIEMRFALGTFNHGGEPMTLDEVAAMCGSDRNTIRKLERQALRKMKKMPMLAGLLEGHEATGGAHHEYEEIEDEEIETLPAQKLRPIRATKSAPVRRRLWQKTCAYCRESFEARKPFAVLCADCRSDARRRTRRADLSGRL